MSFYLDRQVDYCRVRMNPMNTNFSMFMRLIKPPTMVPLEFQKRWGEDWTEEVVSREAHIATDRWACEMMQVPVPSVVLPK